MRFINLYLVGYGVLIVGLILALWKAGVLAQIAPVWIVIALIIATGLGIMFAVRSGKPTMTSGS